MVDQSSIGHISDTIAAAYKKKIYISIYDNVTFFEWNPQTQALNSLKTGQETGYRGFYFYRNTLTIISKSAMYSLDPRNPIGSRKDDKSGFSINCSYPKFRTLFHDNCYYFFDYDQKLVQVDISTYTPTVNILDESI